MEIKIGIGVGEITFGMDRTQVKNILGAPSEKELFSYSEDEDDLTEVWHYDEQEMSLSFDDADDWRLIMIAASDEDFVLQNKSVVGKSYDDIIALLKDMGYTNIEEDAISENDKVVKVEDESLNIWFDDNEASELQWGPKWSDDNTPIFP